MRKNDFVEIFIIGVGFIRCLPHLIIYNIHRNREIIKYEVKHWLRIKKKEYGTMVGFVYLMQFFPEFRNLFYYRVGGFYRRLTRILCSPQSTLFIRAENIGKGLFIHHGFATSIGAKSIGENCWINQQVTIGYKNETDTPTIGNNVCIYAGAIVIGDVHLGDNCVVGANALVLKDVEPNTVVGGVPAKVLKKKQI